MALRSKTRNYVFKRDIHPPSAALTDLPVKNIVFDRADHDTLNGIFRDIIEFFRQASVSGHIKK
jgi:hypothetical protein